MLLPILGQQCKDIAGSESVDMIDDVYNYYDLMQKNNILLLFKGTFSSDLLTSLLEVTEQRLERMKEKPKIRKRVFNVLVECLQNVYLHMDKNKEFDGNAMLILGKKEENYFIVTGNQVLKNKANKLKEKLDDLNNLSSEELRDLYTEVLMEEDMSDEGGAGLGLIDIIRKSKNKVQYKFDNINNDQCFFSLKVNIAN